jgi:spore coat protein CotH
MLMQDYDDNYVKNHYDVPTDEVIIIKNGSEVDEGTESDLELYDQLINFAKNNDLSNATNYAKISEMLDIDSFIEYVCAEVYINNWDWPQNNYRVWRSRTIDPSNPYMDGKWRFMMFDTEYSLGLYTDSSKNGGKGQQTSYDVDSLKLALTTNFNTVDKHRQVLNSLMKNSDFKTKFKATMTDMANKEFSPTHALSVLDRMSTQYKPFMNQNRERFGPDWVLEYYNPPSNHFDEEIGKIRDFISNRRTYIDQAVQKNIP